MRISDWSSDVCSSDLQRDRPGDRDGDLREQLLSGRWCAAAGSDGAAAEGARGTQARDGRYRPGDRRRAIEQQADLRHRSEEHTSELQSLMRISYAVFCLKKKHSTHSITT